ncbi:MAG: prolipoprotein diacylglyceryl transferase [Ruminococcaceae bacterium]|nr:prolipoprotein diacylglyceryl transferase [Oscillospiraceae bacterium]
MNTTVVGFPGLGIEKLELDKVAFTLFGKAEVRWYGILITLGIVLAFLYVMWRGVRNEGVKTDDVIDVGIFTVIAGIIGARLYYVLTTLNDGKHVYESFLDVIAIWNGGIAVYGSIIGGAIAIIIVTHIKKINTLKFCDMVVPGLILAQAVGRWGNFFNGEAHGSIITETTAFDFLGFEFLLPSGEGTLFHTLRMWLFGTAGWSYYHPTFLYESVWCLLGFALLTAFYSHKKFHGQVFLMYCTWYGFGRMFIEGFRTDSLYIPGTSLRISQCVGLVCFLVGGALLSVFWIKLRKNPPISPVIPKVAAESAPVEEAPVEEAAVEEKTAEALGAEASEDEEQVTMEEEKNGDEN